MSDYVVDEEELVNSIYDVSYPKWIYDELPKLEFEFLKQIWEKLRCVYKRRICLLQYILVLIIIINK